MFIQSNNCHVNVVQNCFKVSENDIEKIQWRCAGVFVDFKCSTFIVNLLFKLLPFARIIVWILRKSIALRYI